MSKILVWTNLIMPLPVSSYRLPIAWSVAVTLLCPWLVLIGCQVFDASFLPIADSSLPPYSLAADGQSALSFKQGPDPTLTVQRDSKLSLLLRPSEPVHVPVVLRAFRGRAGQLRRWGAPFETLNDGGFVLRARPDELPEIDSGPWDLVLLIGRPEALPPNPHTLPEGPGGVGWQVLRLRLNIEGERRPGAFLQVGVKITRGSS